MADPILRIDGTLTGPGAAPGVGPRYRPNMNAQSIAQANKMIEDEGIQSANRNMDPHSQASLLNGTAEPYQLNNVGATNASDVSIPSGPSTVPSTGAADAT